MTRRAGIAALLVALACTAAAQGAALHRSAGACAVKVFPGLAPVHLASLSAKPKYNSFPPTSGPHYARPAPWDIYTKELPQVQLVHNLEHGGIVVQYGSGVPAATVAKLRSWYLANTNALLVAPLGKLGAKIALTAWNAPPYSASSNPGHGYVALCSRFDQAAFDAFVKAHRYKAGERFPPSVLARGR